MVGTSGAISGPLLAWCVAIDEIIRQRSPPAGEWEREQALLDEDVAHSLEDVGVRRVPERDGMRGMA